MTSISSEEVNYLIYRYLQEAGFVHSAFAFGQESFIAKTTEIKPTAVPPGMLITLLQRGLHYTSIEFHLNEDGSEKECTRAYSLLEPHVCEKTVPSYPTRAITPKQQQFKVDSVSTSATAMTKNSPASTISTVATSNMSLASSNFTATKKENGTKKRKKEEDFNDKGSKSQNSKKGALNGKSKAAQGSNNNSSRTFSKVNILTGHESEVITCAWNPAKNVHLLASASGDGSARLWTVPGDGSPWDVDEAKMTVKILDHADDVSSSSKDVTTMDWSPDGQTLATGCYDGRARLWSTDGDLLAVLSQHKGPIFQLQWSPNGKLLVSAGLEPSVVVWDVERRALLRSYSHHATPALDVDWRDDATFATCATDKLIHVYRVDEDAPSLVLSGHEDEVNSIRWSPSGEFLLSSSDDQSARVWRVTADGRSGELVAKLSDHSQEIYTAKWNVDDTMLATASFDGTVRLWQLEPIGSAPRCMQTLRKHTQPVYSIAFSPCGKFIVSGSLDGALIVWSVADGRPVRIYQGKGGIFEVTWSCGTTHNDHRLAACTSEKELIVLDTGVIGVTSLSPSTATSSEAPL